MKKIDQHIRKIKDSLDKQKFSKYTVDVIDDGIGIIVEQEHRENIFRSSQKLSPIALINMSLEQIEFDPYKELAQFMRDNIDEEIGRFDSK
jgi:hypothetical protein